MDVGSPTRFSGRGGPIPTLLVVLGGVAMAVSFAAPWTEAGLGSTVSGRELADLLLRGSIESWVPRWTGLALYLVPVCGATVLIGTGLDGRGGRRLAVAAFAVGLGAALSLFAGLSWSPLRTPGAGSRLLVSGLVLVAVGLVASSRSTARASDEEGAEQPGVE